MVVTMLASQAATALSWVDGNAPRTGYDAPTATFVISSSMVVELFNPLMQTEEHDEDVNQEVLFASLAWQCCDWDQLP